MSAVRVCLVSRSPCHVTDTLSTRRNIRFKFNTIVAAVVSACIYLVMSPDSHSPIPTSVTPPRPRSSNKVLPSPLRPNSAPQPSSSQRPTITPTASPQPAIGSAVSPATPPPERSKTRAMDLLRKHYGLSVTPPPPSGRPMDPMDLGQCYLGEHPALD